MIHAEYRPSQGPRPPILILSGSRGRLGCLGADVAERAVDPRSLVPDLDPLEDRQPRLLVRAKRNGRAPAPSSASPRIDWNSLFRRRGRAPDKSTGSGGSVR